MRVKCLHGFFIFEEMRVGQISDFVSLTGLELSALGKNYTFTDLLEAPNYSIQGGALLNFIATSTYEGEPWEVFEANNVVYDFTTGLVVPISSITLKLNISLAGNRYISPGLILPGSFNTSGQRIKSYSGWFSRDTLRWLYSEVEYV